jgi:hypothetical protein
MKRIIPMKSGQDVSVYSKKSGAQIMIRPVHINERLPGPADVVDICIQDVKITISVSGSRLAIETDGDIAGT